ncbi:MAG: 4-(cytidine 5'-diphospho)-2-C-methyl-D-erythritol kinase [Candidatus Dormibacteraeota bacterium]|nr:4-(cytidine 5'-diphospho)-2-C-methyl-D-erythritol kinase [Candidatus Dormibacteraeota bacterium]MBV9525008.1 4-(cytidine 5'-diphospho)-2-C-methyl-D-erythritol kinase [Candidatus Dormibacteraeota bacterium]
MLILPAYAKLNLALDVVARREDGMHDIDSVIVRIDWHDVVGVSVQPADEVEVELRVTGAASAGVPVDGSNLAARAARALLELGGGRHRAQLWLDKRVPHAAGMGGGSADAATTLVATATLLRRHGVDIAHGDLQRIALELGSDVPVALADCAQRVRGRGELLTPVSVAPLHVAVAVAGRSSTAAAFAALAPDEMSDGRRVAELVNQLGAPAEHSGMFGSALEPAARRAAEGLAAAMEQVRALSPRHEWHMTGSGGALFAVVSDRATAEALAAAAGRAGFIARACRTVFSHPSP